jgi:L,D-transpeptidase catalytic domain/Putative peptidoglycan binding domain
VKRAGLALLFVLGLGAAGGVSAGVVRTATTTGATTTSEAVIADGVTIGGVAVGGLTQDEAVATVTSAFEQPLPVLVAGHRLFPTPKRLDASAYVNGAVAQALAALPGSAIKLRVKLDRAKASAYVAAVAKRFDRKPLDAQLGLRNLRPVVSRERAGRSLRRVQSLGRIFDALVANSRAQVQLDFKSLLPKVTRRSIGPVIVIRRGSNHLYLYDGTRFWRVFGVATGQSQYPTPLGRWQIVVKWRNPWWYPPHSTWAQGAKPIPPGPGNPLGTRWMGLSASGVGIHGTPDDASIGYSASHGCIRMHIPDAEWLFNHVRIGTTVFIVSA